MSTIEVLNLIGLFVKIEFVSENGANGRIISCKERTESTSQQNSESSPDQLNKGK